MAITWDERKNETNQAKHGIAFEDAALVFDDPLKVSFPERNVEGEERWLTIGASGDLIILTVAHTFTEEGAEENIRIISARKATPSERKYYEEAYR